MYYIQSLWLVEKGVFLLNTNKEIKTVYSIVKGLLEKEELCRNDDKYLTFRVMQHFTKIYIPFEDFKKIPAFETIKRCRAKIQNDEGKLLPTIDKVRFRRRQRQHAFKQWAAE